MFLASLPDTDPVQMMDTLKVDFLKLARCVVSPGWRLLLDASEQAGIHYSLFGGGRMIIDEAAPIALQPHTLVIVPPGRRFQIEVRNDQYPDTELSTVDGRVQAFDSGGMQTFIAGVGGPRLQLICGYFQASYRDTLNLFAGLSAPMVQQFDASDQLDVDLLSALDELAAQAVGSGAMTKSLLTQVLLTILRRSLAASPSCCLMPRG